MLKSSCQAVEWFGVNSKRLWLRIGMNHDTQNELWGGEVVLLTASEFEALEARKPQVPAEVIARTQGALIGWRHADEFDTEELQEHGDVLRDATRALLAAVEAAPDAPDEERLTEAERARRWLNVHGHLSTTHGGPPCPRWCGKLSLLTDDGHFVRATEALDGYASEEALLVALKDIVERKHFATPDFAAMDPDDLSLEEVQALRDWLDARGRLYEGRATGEEVPFHAWFGGGGAVGAGYGSTREAALLAFCQKVAAEEAS